MAARVIAVADVGWKARDLIDGARSASVVAALSRSLYLDVGGQIVWLGGPGGTMHPRAILAAALPDAGDARRLDVSFDLRAAREWRPPALPSPIPREMLARESRRLAGLIDRLGPPDGFGALLAGRCPAFPLAHAVDDALGFLDACARDDAPAAAAHADRLLGLGPGLTPAGDDLVGGAFFARALWGWGATPWEDAKTSIRARAPERTHRISATLLGDLLDGAGYAPMHDLAGALARGESAGALDAAARLVRIGHSSGWDMLAGLLGALGALGALPRR